MKENHIKVLKWIFVLPISFLTQFIVSGIFILIALIRLLFSDTDAYMDRIVMWSTENIIPIISGLLSSYFFVISGAMVAPSNKKTVALILLILLCTISGMSVGILLMEEFDYFLLIKLVADLLGGITGFYIIQNEKYEVD